MKKGKWIVLLASVCALFVFCVFQIRYEDKTDTQLTVLSQQKLNKLKERLKDVSGQPELSLSLSFAESRCPTMLPRAHSFCLLIWTRRSMRAAALREL